jgi:hypothetical protein
MRCSAPGMEGDAYGWGHARRPEGDAIRPPASCAGNLSEAHALSITNYPLLRNRPVYSRDLLYYNVALDGATTEPVENDMAAKWLAQLSVREATKIARGTQRLSG